MIKNNLRNNADKRKKAQSKCKTEKKFIVDKNIFEEVYVYHSHE